jgi:hypothetical protein
MLCFAKGIGQNPGLDGRQFAHARMSGSEVFEAGAKANPVWSLLYSCCEREIDGIFP